MTDLDHPPGSYDLMVRALRNVAVPLVWFG
jgi:hypothetical protein